MFQNKIKIDLRGVSFKNCHLFCYKIQIHKNDSHFLQEPRFKRITCFKARLYLITHRRIFRLIANHKTFNITFYSKNQADVLP